MSDPKGETPHPDHPHEDEFEFEMHEHAADESPHGAEHAAEGHAADEHAAAEPDPLDELGINASSEDFQFSGPAEELDFTEPADFTFPTEHMEAEAGADSSAEIATHEPAGLEHLFGGDEAAHHEAEVGEEAAPVVESAEDEAGEIEVEEEPKPKPKRELPAWVRTLEWVTVGLLAAIGLIVPFVAIIWIGDADTVTLIVNICFPIMLGLVPYALWRSSRRWTTPAVSALYTVLLAVSVAALIGGAWVEGMELSQLKWQFNKSRVAAGKPPAKFFAPPPDSPAETGQK